MIRNRQIAFAACVLVCIVAAVASEDLCSQLGSCSDCIQTPGCAWCFKDGLQKLQRCFLHTETNRCDSANTIYPTNYIKITSDKELSKHGSDGNTVTMKPQKVGLKLRKNEQIKISVTYVQAEDYPIDLYYIMDVSNTMRKEKNNLIKLAKKLSNEMNNLTESYRMGFGSFVDKVIMPFTNPVTDLTTYDEPYGFINQLSLTKDTDAFMNAVKNSKISGNLDDPEGQLDAIMQAAVCTEQIGWDANARRLLVVSTDAIYHHAGDGKLAGITKPNDGKCHLSYKKIGGVIKQHYDYSTVQDYPSISHINYRIQENFINLIFLVKNKVKNVYEQLSQDIDGSHVGILDEKSEEVPKLLAEQYNAITSAIKMTDNSNDDVEIKYFSSCLNKDEPEIETDTCEQLQVGSKVTFNLQITLKTCSARRQEWNQTITVKPRGMSESLVIDLEMLCGCSCENPGQTGYIAKAEGVCNGNGDSVCGECSCDHEHLGAKCECRRHGTEMMSDLTCRPGTSDKEPVCSGRGTCSCGQCTHCNEGFSGRYCECDNAHCKMNKGKMCSGNGECRCGECQCHDKYQGETCDCVKSEETCRSPENDLICHGNGRCACGKCQCSTESEKYSGQYCEKCTVCQGRCKEYRECVLCRVHQRGKLYDPSAEGLRCGACSSLDLTVVDEDLTARDNSADHLCNFEDELDNCVYVFVYTYGTNKSVAIRAQKERICPPKVSVVPIVLGVFGGVVVIGVVLLLAWKAATTYADRREYAKFERDRALGTFQGENPIYKEARSTFKNPMYKED